MANRNEAIQDKVVGGLKTVAGTVTFNEDLRKDGEDQMSGGDKKYEAAQKKDKAESAKNDVTGHAKEAVGSVGNAIGIDNNVEDHGKEDQAKADALHEKSKV